MKQVNISIHPFSALVGMAVLSMAWVTAAAMPLQGSSSDRDVSAIENVNDPHPRDYVRVVEGVPYTVPVGRIFVGRGMGFAGDPGISSWWLSMQVGGQDVLSESGYYYPNNSGTWHDQVLTSFPFGVTAQASEVVSVGSSKSDGVLLGYLVDA